MSYRTTVNDVQIFGNNESYDAWLDYIKSQGIKVNDEGNYEGDITDFHGALVAVESIVKDMMQKRKSDWEKYRVHIESILKRDPENEYALKQKADQTHSYLDFSHYEKDIWEYHDSLLDTLFIIANQSYAFFPYTLYMACQDQLEPLDPINEPDGTYRIRNFRFKGGASAHVKAG